MKTALRFAAGLGLALGLLAARPAAAQFSAAIGAHLGYSKSKDADSGSFIGGAQLRLRLLSFIGAEALVEYRKSTYQAGGVDVLKVEDFPVQLSAMLYLAPTGPFQVYALGGYGAHITKSTGLGPNAAYADTSQTKWAPHVGGGLEIWTSQNLFLTADIRYTFLSIGSLSDVESQYQTGSLSANYWSATLGLNYKF
ncbi:MAG: outer membrane protein [Thermoanaerobaculia bacterium]